MRLPAVLAATLVLAATGAAALLPATEQHRAPAPATPRASHAGHEHESVGPGAAEAHASDHDDHSLDPSASGGAGAGDFAWSPPQGAIPDRDDPGLRRLRNLEARTDRGLAELAAQGWLRGQGTREDPYVIERLRVANDLTLRDTAAYVIVRENVVLGQLSLNWNGQAIHVHHNDIRDLRVNENIERYADVTGGLVEENRIGFIGQLRHFSGEFRHNQVGPKPAGPFEMALGDAGPFAVADEEVWNFDGFHGAKVHHNTIVGMVNIKLHGHHHGSALDALAHEHHTDMGHAEGVDHTVRHHQLAFTDNAITVPQGPALIYRDTPHAADDRTATSETNPELELAHVHKTLVELAHNRLTGGGLVLRVFNSADDRHKGGDEGAMRIAGNHIRFPAPEGPAAMLARGNGIGLDLHDAADLDLLVEGNEVVFEPGSAKSGLPLLGKATEAKGTGVLLRGYAASALTIAQNTVHGAAVGLRARDFDAATQWWLRDNAFGAATPVDYDGSVANAPK